MSWFKKSALSRFRGDMNKVRKVAARGTMIEALGLHRDAIRQLISSGDREAIAAGVRDVLADIDWLASVNLWSAINTFQTLQANFPMIVQTEEATTAFVEVVLEHVSDDDFPEVWDRISLFVSNLLEQDSLASVHVLERVLRVAPEGIVSPEFQRRSATRLLDDAYDALVRASTAEVAPQYQDALQLLRINGRPIDPNEALYALANRLNDEGHEAKALAVLEQISGDSSQAHLHLAYRLAGEARETLLAQLPVDHQHVRPRDRGAGTKARPAWTKACREAKAIMHDALQRVERSGANIPDDLHALSIAIGVIADEVPVGDRTAPQPTAVARFWLGVGAIRRGDVAEARDLIARTGPEGAAGAWTDHEGAIAAYLAEDWALCGQYARSFYKRYGAEWSDHVVLGPLHLIFAAERSDPALAVALAACVDSSVLDGQPDGMPELLAAAALRAASEEGRKGDLITAEEHASFAISLMESTTT